jgi:hypothetical protein
VLFDLRYGVESREAGSTLIVSTILSALNARGGADIHGGQLMRGSVAILCSGQAGQYLEMFDLVSPL